MPLLGTLAHYFVPGHTNNHKAKILHSTSLVGIAFVFLIYQLVLQILPRSGVKVLGYASNIPPATVTNLINEERLKAGLPALTYNSQLASAAKAKGDDMLAKDYWAHVAPDGTEPWAFFLAAGYKYRYAGENLARDFSDAQSAVSAWMASPSHRDNIMSSKYRETGVAVVEGDMAGVDTTLIVQLFGTQLSAPGEIQIAQAQTAASPTPTKKPVPTRVPTVVPTKAPSVTAEITPTAAVVAQISPQVSPPPDNNERLTESAPTAQTKVSGFKLLLSPFDVTRTMSLVTIIVLSVVLIVDAWVVSKRKITRLSGRNFAHLAFLGVILSIIIIAGAGEIL